MRLAFCFLPAVLGACQIPTEREERGQGVVHFFLGGRSVDDARFWDTLEDQFAAGFDVTLQAPDQTIGWTFGTTWAGARGSASTNGADPVTVAIELYLGPRATVPLGRSPLRFYGGLGPSLAHAVVDTDPRLGVGSVRASDWGLGVYGQLGLLYRASERVSLGLEYRTLRLADMDFFGRETDMDYEQLALLVAMDF